MITLNLLRTKNLGGTMRKIGSLATAALLVFSLSACKKEEGPAEKAGKEVDKAFKEAGKAVEKQPSQ
jgi:hypothetical protein